VTINNQTEWDAPAKFAFAMNILLFLRDVTLITVFFIKKFIDHSEDPSIRPLAEGRYTTARVDMDQLTNITKYL
jgi:hypothetical protein